MDKTTVDAMGAAGSVIHRPAGYRGGTLESKTNFFAAARGPVLRGWSALLEITVEARGDQLRLVPLDESGTVIRNHFLQLDGLGVRGRILVEGLAEVAMPTQALP